MTKEELKDKLIIIQREKDTKERAILKEYALSNAIYRVGDIIEDHIGRIKIEGISWSVMHGGNDSIAVYLGTQLKKDLTPFKSGEKRAVYQHSIKRCIAE